MSRLKRLAQAMAQRIGRFLSDFPSVILTLCIYILLTILTYGWLKIAVASIPPSHMFATYELATGADPASFVASMKDQPLLWYWILTFHVMSWLIVPILAATAVTSAFNIWEERKQRLEARLIAIMVSIIQKNTRLSEEEAVRLATEATEEIGNEAKLR